MLPESDLDNAFTLFFDGACHKSTTIVAGGFVIKDSIGKTVKHEALHMLHYVLIFAFVKP